MEKQIEYLTDLICADCAEYDDCEWGHGKCECVRREARMIVESGFRMERESVWVYDEDSDCVICNMCGEKAPIDQDTSKAIKSKFCPNCGARMFREVN